MGRNSTLGCVQWTWHFRVIDYSGPLLEKHIVCPNDIVFRYFYYPVIFPNLLAASNLMLPLETWFTEVVITKRLTAPLPGKWKYRKIVYIPLLKRPFEAIISAKRVLITYSVVDNIPRTHIKNFFMILSNYFMKLLLIIWPSSRTTIRISRRDFPKSIDVWKKTILAWHIY